MRHFIMIVASLFLSLTFMVSCATSESTQEINLPDKPERATEEEFVEQVEKIHALSEEELLELNEIAIMAVMLLPEEERETLLELQERFAYGGYEALSDAELITMQQSNQKALMLLPKEYQERFQYLADKIANQ